MPLGSSVNADPIPLATTPSFALAVSLLSADEFADALVLLRRIRERAEERAEDSALPWILAQLGLAEFLSGDWAAALRTAQEGIEVAHQVGQEPQRLFALGVRALGACVNRADRQCAG